jgi:hypothetical protein
MRGQKFFKIFFEEKQLPDEHWELVAEDGTPNYIGTDVVIEHLTMDGAANYFGPDVYRKIEDTIRMIDFKNGNVNHYLHFLACGLAGANPELPENKYRKE